MKHNNDFKPDICLWYKIKIKGSGKKIKNLPDPLIFLPQINMVFKNIIVLETASDMYLKRFCERRMKMQVFPLTLWMNQEISPAIFINFLVALNFVSTGSPL